MGHIQYLDHTGDAGIIIQAASPEELFGSCALAMFQIICPQQITADHIHHHISLSEPDSEQLLVAWLNELNYLFQTGQFLLSAVEKLVITGTALEASVAGGLVDSQLHLFIREIKAVTYHKLYIKKVKELWQAQVVFDL